MAKLTKRFNVKGFVDAQSLTILEKGKDGDNHEHSIEEIVETFDRLEGVTFTMSYDDEVVPE